MASGGLSVRQQEAHATCIESGEVDATWPGPWPRRWLWPGLDREVCFRRIDYSPSGDVGPGAGGAREAGDGLEAEGGAGDGEHRDAAAFWEEEGEDEEGCGRR